MTYNQIGLDVEFANFAGRCLDQARELTNAIANPLEHPVDDETGSTVTSLATAIMGVTSGLCAIADTINGLAKAVESHRKP